MQANPVSQMQQAVPAERTQSKSADAKVAGAVNKVPPQADTVMLSERAKDLAAQLAGKAAQEEAFEPMAAKKLEELSAPLAQT